MKKAQMTLLELSNKLQEKGYPDLFDFAVDGDILDLDSMTGSVADDNGDNIVEFKIIKLGEDSNTRVGDEYLTHLGTIIEINKDYIL